MAGYNPNYFNRNLIESMKKTIVEGLGDQNLGIGGEGDWGKVSDLQLQNRMRHHKQHGFLGAEVPEEKQTKEYLAAKKEFERRQAAKQPKAEPAVPGLKGQPAGAGPDERATAAGQQLPPSAPFKAPTTPPPVTPSKAAQFGSSMFGGPGRVVSSTSTTAEGKPETTVGITPGETPRQRQMADPELQGKINPEKDLSGFFDVTRGIFNRSATPTGKAIEPQDIRPEPTTQMPTPRQASGASIQSAKPGQIPQNVIDALRKPMGPKAIK